jgi:hypothetical protein
MLCHGRGKIFKTMKLFVPHLRVPGNLKGKLQTQEWRRTHREIVVGYRKRYYTSSWVKRAQRKYKAKYRLTQKCRDYMREYMRKYRLLIKKNNVSTIIDT